MKRIFQVILCAVAFVLVFAAKPILFSPLQTNTQLLSGSDWVIHTAVVAPSYVDTSTGDTISNLLGITADCHKDDTLSFSSNGDYTFDNGSSKCDSSENQLLNYSWFFNTAEDTLAIISYEDDSAKTFPDTSYMTIIKLVNDTLRLGITQPIDTNMHVNVVTYVAN